MLVPFPDYAPCFFAKLIVFINHAERISTNGAILLKMCLLEIDIIFVEGLGGAQIAFRMSGESTKRLGCIDLIQGYAV